MESTQPLIKKVASFTVTGFAARTQNSDEFNATAKIPTLWHQFYSSNPTINMPIYGVYSDYASDANGLYTITVGSGENTALSSITINSGNYLVFQGKGSMPLTVIETWKRVWEYFTSESVYRRCFITDFEAYTNSDEVAIYIGVK
jgi:predicted transcriptional regulator YdeE